MLSIWLAVEKVIFSWLKCMSLKQAKLIYDNDIDLVIVHLKQIKVLLQKSYVTYLCMTYLYASYYIYLLMLSNCVIQIDGNLNAIPIHKS